VGLCSACEEVVKWVNDAATQPWGRARIEPACLWGRVIRRGEGVAPRDSWPIFARQAQTRREVRLVNIPLGRELDTDEPFTP
jgi:hypothetical protein